MKFKINKNMVEEEVDYSKLSTVELWRRLRELEEEYGREMVRNLDENCRRYSHQSA